MNHFLKYKKIFLMFQAKFERLVHIQSRLGKHDLVTPGRELVKEGELSKISANHNKADSLNLQILRCHNYSTL